MVMPLTRIWFILAGIQYRRSNGELTEERPAFAEYNLVKRQLVWKEWNDEQDDKNMNVVRKIMLLAPLSSAFIIVPIIGFMNRYTGLKTTPQMRLGEHWISIPIIVGFFMFLAFDFYMVNIRQKTKVVKQPDEESIRTYFRVVSLNDLSKNHYPHDIPIPWRSILGLAGGVFMTIALMFWLYDRPDTWLTFINKLFVLSFLIGVFFLTVWYLLGRAIVIKRVFKKLNAESEAKANFERKDNKDKKKKRGRK